MTNGSRNISWKSTNTQRCNKMTNHVYTTDEVDNIIKSIDDRIAGIIADSNKAVEELDKKINDINIRINELFAIKEKLKSTGTNYANRNKQH